jgi:hypothetical protein
MEAQGKGFLSAFADFFWRDYLNGSQAGVRDHFLSPAVSNEERMQLLAKCSQIVLYLKGDLPLDNEVIEALIWAVSRYGHEVLGIEPRIDLQSHLLRCARTEPELHVLKEYYRDHFFHCLEVCFLGHFLLELRIEGEFLWKMGGEFLWEKVGGILGLESKTEVLGLWYLAALLHDVGYLMDALKATNESLGFFKNSGMVREFAADVQKAMDTLSAEIDKEDFCEYIAKDKPGEDHGVISALHLEGLLKSIAEGYEQVKVGWYGPAIRAIAMHNSRKHRVSFEKEPLGFLLILCDTIQEWVRPRLIYSTAPVQMLTWLMGQGAEPETLTGPFRSLTIHQIGWEDQGKYYELIPTDRRNRLYFTLEYNEGINRNSGVFNLWLDATYNLQRLDMTGLGVEIDVEYITPFYQQRPGMDFEQQFHRLQSAVAETHMGFLEKWFPAEKVGEHVTNGAVEYWAEGADGQAKEEHLVLHLRRLSKAKRITKDIDAFRARLKKWKRYNEDRDFSGDYAPAVPD